MVNLQGTIVKLQENIINQQNENKTFMTNFQATMTIFQKTLLDLNENVKKVGDKLT